LFGLKKREKKKREGDEVCTKIGQGVKKKDVSSWIPQTKRSI
jgi:hypothetical protein